MTKFNKGGSVRVFARLAAIFVFVLGLHALPQSAEAGVLVKVSRASQTMNVYVNGALHYSWAVSTGRRGFTTPGGSYRPTRLERMHYSRKYHMSPMPHSIFFRGGYAIHGTHETRRLGRRASHGCIRLHRSNARRLYSLVRRYGRAGTKIVIR